MGTALECAGAAADVKTGRSVLSGEEAGDSGSLRNMAVAKIGIQVARGRSTPPNIGRLALPRKWEKLEMSPVEQRKVLCSITFHVVAITCVVWSLYVLIDRTAEEMRTGQLEWPFWTKLIVVAIGFTGGLVFMYVQCKMYVQLFKRWRAFNRIIYVQNAPEKAAILAAELGSVLKVDMPDQEKRFSPDEEFHSCQSGSSETVNAVDQQQPLEKDPAVVVVVSSVTTSPTSTTLSLATTTTTSTSASTRTTITITENMFGDLPLRDTVLVTQQPPILVKEAVFEDEDNLTEIVVPQQQTTAS